MKKLIGILLSALLLTGCAATPGAGSSAGETPEAAAGKATGYTLETETVSDSVQADDGTVLYEYTYDLPRLIYRSDSEGPEEDTAATTTFNAAFDVWREGKEREETIESAQLDYDWRQGEGQDWRQYAEALTYTAYQTDRLISIVGEYYWDYGGAHPNVSYQTWNFDLKKGEYIPEDTLGNEAMAQAVTEELLRQMEEQAKKIDAPLDALYFSNYQEIAAQWMSHSVSFDAKGMTVTFSPYALAPYGAGPQNFHIPYGFLEPYLSEYGKEVLPLSQGGNLK